MKMDENGHLNNAADFVKNVNLVNVQKFGQNSEMWTQFQNLLKILKFGPNSEIQLKF